ncbi:MAG: (4Fe-4S)-binding protein [Comamonadaceae bacterium]|nr:(4Fe-4S)-binding protein [Comamonadaceae bacterium]
MSETSEYRGSGLVVRYDVKRCIHAAECVKGLPQVFDPNAKPWVQPGKAAAGKVIAVIGRCPTGALSVTREDGEACEKTPAANEARLVADGPIYLHGDIEIYDGDGKLTGRETRVALCRCGASKNKPFCDNSHKGSGFRHDGSCGETDQAQTRSPPARSSSPCSPVGRRSATDRSPFSTPSARSRRAPSSAGSAAAAVPPTNRSATAATRPSVSPADRQRAAG